MRYLLTIVMKKVILHFRARNLKTPGNNFITVDHIQLDWACACPIMQSLFFQTDFSSACLLLPRSTASSSSLGLRPVASLAVGRGEIREEAEAGGGGDPSEPQEHVTTKKWLLPDVRN